MAFNKYHSLFCCDLRLNLLANLGTMWFGPSSDFLRLIFRSSTIIFSCGLAPHGILLTNSLSFRAETFSLFPYSLPNLGTMWFGPSLDF